MKLDREREKILREQYQIQVGKSAEVITPVSRAKLSCFHSRVLPLLLFNIAPTSLLILGIFD